MEKGPPLRQEREKLDPLEAHRGPKDRPPSRCAEARSAGGPTRGDRVDCFRRRVLVGRDRPFMDRLIWRSVGFSGSHRVWVALILCTLLLDCSRTTHSAPAKEGARSLLFLFTDECGLWDADLMPTQDLQTDPFAPADNEPFGPSILRHFFALVLSV